MNFKENLRLFARDVAEWLGEKIDVRGPDRMVDTVDDRPAASKIIPAGAA